MCLNWHTPLFGKRNWADSIFYTLKFMYSSIGVDTHQQKSFLSLKQINTSMYDSIPESGYQPTTRVIILHQKFCQFVMSNSSFRTIITMEECFLHLIRIQQSYPTIYFCIPWVILITLYCCSDNFIILVEHSTLWYLHGLNLKYT